MVKAIKVIDRSNATLICNEMLEVLNKHFEGSNLQFTRSTGSYNSDSIGVKITASLVRDSSGESVHTPLEKDYNFMRTMYGLPPLNTEFKRDGIRYQIVGASRRSHKFPILCKTLSTNPKTYKFTVDTVKALCRA
jgi:hypothetical protein